MGGTILRMLTKLIMLVAVMLFSCVVSGGALAQTDPDLLAARQSGTVLLQTDFSQENPDDWVLEGNGVMRLIPGAMVIEAVDKDATIWHKKQLHGDVLIEFEARIDPPVAAANLNTFVHAVDPAGRPVYEGNRSGAYAEYHTLNLYIFTFTGDQGRAGAPGYARIRKDPGFSLLAENLDFESETGKTYKISILVENGRLRYYINDVKAHDYTDSQPYRQGWMAFRTWNTNLTITSLVVKQLREFVADEPTQPTAQESVEYRRNLIPNGDFEDGVATDGVPVEWTVFGSSFGSVVADAASSGSHSLRLVDNDANVGGGLRSKEVPTTPGTPYRLEVDAYPLNGRGGIYLDFMAGGKRVNALQKATSSNSAGWETIVIEATAPQGAETVSIILYSYKPDIATVYFDNVRLYDLSQAEAVISNRESTTRETGYRPGVGAEVETNPPSFVWLPESWAQQYVLEYSTSPDFASGSTIRVEGLDYSMHLPAEPLVEGTWYWRYWGVTQDGVRVGPSVARRFQVTADAIPVSLPPVHEARARITDQHPRLFITPEQLPELKTRWNPLLLPTLFRSGYNASIIGPNLFKLQPTASEVTDALATLQELGVLWAATGQERYAQAGRALIMHMTKVDPMPAHVPTGTGKDAIFMALIPGMSRSYDWLHHALTEEERAVVLAYLQDLGERTFQRLRTPPYEADPYRSHEGRILGFLAELAIATLGELPDAEKWFDYVLQVIYNVYPAWGGVDGGWSEGANYWASYMNFMFDAMDAVEMATGVKLYQKPFFQNTGYYKMYTHPPLTGVAWGDGLGKAVDANSRAAMTRLAEMTGNGHFTWYAQTTGGIQRRGGIVGVLTETKVPPAKAPTDLPPARYFADVGLVTMHTNLADPEENVAFQLRSSPYGSISHAHADQNSFVLYSYGDGVAISSGYYPWSQSPHHSEWTNQTLSKNTVLINGEGQRTFSLDAKGRIEQFIHTEEYDYTVGEAATAYNTAVDAYKRHVVFIRPDLFVIVDDVRTPEASTVDWLLHSAFPLTWDEEANKAHTTGAKGQLDTHLISEQEWSAVISDEFAPPPELDDYEPQWHLTLSNLHTARRHLVVAVLIPNKAGEKAVQLINATVSTQEEIMTITLEYVKDGMAQRRIITLGLDDAGIAQGPTVH